MAEEASAVGRRRTSRSAEELLSALTEVLRSYVREPSLPRYRCSTGAGGDSSIGPDMVDVDSGSGEDQSLRTGRFPGVSVPKSLSSALLGLGLGRGAHDQSQRRLDEIERDADFWCDLVGGSFPYQQARGRMHHVRSLSCEELNDVRENVLEDFFDLTPERVVEVYDRMTRDSEGRVSAEALGEALRVCGLTGIARDVPARILAAVAPGCDGKLQPTEFETILSRLKIAHLLVSRHDLTSWSMAGIPCVTVKQLTVVDYDARGAMVSICAEARLREFFFGHRPAPKTPSNPGVRWVNLSGLDSTMLLALTVKYSLHPLAVEDVIEQCRTKLDRYGDHFFAVIERLYLFTEPRADTPVEVAGGHISMFCSGPPNLDTLVTISQPDRSFPGDWPGYKDPEQILTDSAAIAVNIGAGDIWALRLRHRIEAQRSRIRERRAHFLLLQVFDICTDDIVEVTYAYTMRLGHLEAELNSKGASLGEGWLDEMSTIRLQLGVAMRRVRGMLRALRQMDIPDLKEDLKEDLSGYVRDITDHLDDAFEDMHSLVEKCGALIHSHESTLERSQDAARQNASDRLNNTLFALTVFTSIFMPLQLLAGVYGMNFVDAAGRTSIPELLWPHGYTYFWIASGAYLLVSCIFAVLLFNRRKSDLPKENTATPTLARTVGPAQAPRTNALERRRTTGTHMQDSLVGQPRRVLEVGE